MSAGTVIKVDGISKTFKLPHEKHNSIKSLLVNFRKRDKGYERQQALDNISFEVKEGDFLGIVGRNGGGKSTLLKMLAGIYAPDSGVIDVYGKLTPFIELGVGFNPELSGRENVYLNGALLGFNRKEVGAMYEDIVAFAELERFMDQKLKNYSSGMQVRLAFSIAIRAQSDILLLDEVLAVGDAAFQQKCFDYFEKLKAENKTVVFVTHDMGAVRRFCNRAVYIKKGKLIHDGTPEEVADLYMTENIESTSTAENPGVTLSSAHKITASVVAQKKGVTKLSFKYTAKDREEMYVAISILKDGISVAELTTSLERPLVGSGVVTYSLDTSIFNAGVYQVNTVLCKKEGRALLSLSKNPITFTVQGIDETRGSAVRLPDGWDYSKA